MTLAHVMSETEILENSPWLVNVPCSRPTSPWIRPEEYIIYTVYTLLRKEPVDNNPCQPRNRRIVKKTPQPMHANRSGNQHTSDDQGRYTLHSWESSRRIVTVRITNTHHWMRNTDIPLPLLSTTLTPMLTVELR